jgi:hypothetical protein
MSEYRAPGRVYARVDVLLLGAVHFISGKSLCPAGVRHIASSAEMLSERVVATVSVHRFPDPVVSVARGDGWDCELRVAVASVDCDVRVLVAKRCLC